MGTLLKPVPTSTALLSARCRGVCRLCGQSVILWVETDYPQEFDKPCVTIIPDRNVTLNYGEEFAHTSCLTNENSNE